MLKWFTQWRDRRKQERAAKARTYVERQYDRLRHPDFDAFARCFGGEISPMLKRLYADHVELVWVDVLRYTRPDAREDANIFVAFYIPADEQSLEDRWPDNSAFFEFADDGLGNRYVVDPVVTDPPILFYDHEEHWHKRTGVTLSQYLQTPPDEDNDTEL